MASSSLLGIASGPTVVTWDCRQEVSQDEISSLKSFHPFSNSKAAAASPENSVTDIAWNHNAQVLAACSSATSLDEQVRKNVVLMSSQSGTTLDSFRHTDSKSQHIKNLPSQREAGSPGAAATTCVAFGGKSRYLCIGDKQGDVCLWDLKKQSRVRQFKAQKRHQPCLQACLDPTATYVCSLSSDTFTLYRLRQATLAKQWDFTSHNQHIASNSKHGWNQFRFSPLQPSLMALGDSTGRIQLHDSLEYDQPQLVCGGGYTSNGSTTSIILPHHASPITGLAFSTQNSKLLANIRGNGILEFVDTGTGEVIHHQPTGGGSATALAFQGVSCVVGTDTGEVQVYDLRKMMQQFGKAVTTYRMPHGNAVTTLEFAPLPKPASGSTRDPSRSRTRSSSPPSRQPSGSGNSVGFSAASISFDLESRASVVSYQEPPFLSHPNTVQDNNPEEPQRHSMDDSEDRKLPASTSEASTKASSTSVKTNYAAPNISMGSITRSVPTSTSAAAATAQSTQDSVLRPQHSIDAIDRYAKMSSSSQSAQIPSVAASRTAPSLFTARSNSSTTSNTHSDHQAFPNENQIINNNKSNYSNTNNSSNNPMTRNRQTSPSPEMTSVLQNMIRHELQQHMFGFREDLEGSIRNLHVDMIRQFQRQSQEMMLVVRQQQQEIEQLMQENQFLRDQNAALLQQHEHRGGGGKNGYKYDNR